MKSEQGEAALGWLLGAGQARGIALVFLVAGLVMVLVALLALGSGQYRKLSKIFAAQKQNEPETNQAVAD